MTFSEIKSLFICLVSINLCSNIVKLNSLGAFMDIGGGEGENLRSNGLPKANTRSVYTRSSE